MTVVAVVLMVELGLALLGALVFLALYGNPNRYQDRSVAWHVFAFTAVSAAELASLLALGLGFVPPRWLFIGVYGAATVVVWWRLVLLLQSRRRPGS